MEKSIQTSDFEWFLNNYIDLFAEYGDCFLAIKNKAVLGSYASYADALRATEKNEELGTFIIQHCNGDQSGYTNRISSMNFMGAVG
ncbi:MAG: hypothetical protein IKI75_08375 [Lachnospiraceae bacterium]|nr:hypothetical protein [Lachnospiraceae bacterium]